METPLLKCLSDSNVYLYKMNSDKLKLEEQIKQHIEEDFYEFKKGGVVERPTGSAVGYVF